MHPRTPRAAVALVAAALAAFAATAPLAAAQEEDVRSFVFIAHDENEQHWFEFDDVAGQNPNVGFEAGWTVEVTLRNSGTEPHSIFFGDPIGEGTEPVPPGGSATIRFEVPDDITDESTTYFDPEYPEEMRGTVNFVPAGGDAGGIAESVGPALTPVLVMALAVLLVVLFVGGALLARRRRR